MLVARAIENQCYVAGVNRVAKFFQVVSNIVPARWYIDAVRKMMIQGLPIVAVWKNCVILLGMTVAILGVVKIRKSVLVLNLINLCDNRGKIA